MGVKIRQLAQPENPWVMYNVKLVIDQISKNYRKTKNIQKIIDIPCGKGEYLYHLSMSFPPSILVGVDISRKQLAFAKRFKSKKVNLVVADACALPFKNSAFDLAFSKDILHHTEYPITVLREIKRISKRVVIVEANRPNLIMLMFTKYYDEQHFTSDQLKSLIENAGLKIQKFEQFHAYPATFILRSKNPIIALYNALMITFLAVTWRFSILTRLFWRLLSLLCMKPSFNVAHV